LEIALRVYAKEQAGQPARHLADFPDAAEATVGVRAELQYFARPPPEGRTLIVETTSAQRTVHARLEASESTAFQAVGAAFPAGSLGPGDARVCTVLSAAGHAGTEELTLDALERGGFTAQRPTCSTLRVVP
jgi:hypothetical protein